VDIPVLHAERLTLRPLTDEDVEHLVAIVAAPGVREWWGTPDTPERDREGLRNDGAAFAVEIAEPRKVREIVEVANEVLAPLADPDLCEPHLHSFQTFPFSWPFLPVALRKSTTSWASSTSCS